MTTEAVRPGVATAGTQRRAPQPQPQPPWRDAVVAIATLTWIPGVLLLDRDAGIWWQRALGVGTWALLLLLLRAETPLVRAQVAVVIAFASAVEYTFSPLLQVYVYRLHNVPSFVPPGHGLVYLCALALGRSAVFGVHRRRLVLATVALGGGYAAWGLLLSDRRDVLGAFWFCCLLGFLRWGRSVTLYVGAFFAVTYLEVLGTWIGTWEWQPHDPTGLVAIGNPPSGAAGGYGWFDLVATLAAPALLTALGRLAGVSASPAGRARPRAAGRWWPARCRRPARAPRTDR